MNENFQAEDYSVSLRNQNQTMFHYDVVFDVVVIQQTNRQRSYKTSKFKTAHSAIKGCGMTNGNQNKREKYVQINVRK